MLKYLFFIIFMLFLLKLNKYFWLLQELFLLNFVMMMFLSLPSFYYTMNFFVFLDYLSYGLIILSIWICSLMLMASKKIFFYSDNNGMFMFLLIFLMIFLFLSFSVFNLFMFYLFFEMSLIPTLYLILGWGYQPERIQASFYLLFYTLFASLPLLMGIFLINFSLLNLNYFMFNVLEYTKNFSIFYLMMIMALLVKMPMFLVHLWLPKAHVEAPISGSMILAGILLKLGGYGLIRILSFLQFMNLYMNSYFISISLMGGFLISLNCLQQVDFKSLIAYSSVVHMGLILASMFNCSMWSILNSYLMMIAHGLCSSGLFCIANISYERLMNRSLLINKGLLMLMPSMAIWWFFLCSSNMSAPPTLNLLSEIGLLMSILNWSMFSLLMIMMITFFSAGYCLYLFSYSQHGNLFSLIFSYSSNSSREYLLLFLHWIPLNIFILKSEFFLFWL